MEWNRIGTFKITRIYISNLPITELRKIFKDIVVVHAENLFHEESIKYTAIGKVFDIRKDYETVPEYRVDIIGKDTKGRFQRIDKVKFVKV